MLHKSMFLVARRMQPRMRLFFKEAPSETFCTFLLKHFCLLTMAASILGGFQGIGLVVGKIRIGIYTVSCRQFSEGPSRSCVF